MKKIFGVIVLAAFVCNGWSGISFYGMETEFAGEWEVNPSPPYREGGIGTFHADFSFDKNLPAETAYWYLAPDFQVNQYFGDHASMITGADEDGIFLQVPSSVNLRVSWEEMGYEYHDGLGIYLGYGQAPSWLEGFEIDPYLGAYSWDLNNNGKNDLEAELSKDPSEDLPYSLDVIFYSMLALPSRHPFGPFLDLWQYFPGMPEELIDCLEAIAAHTHYSIPLPKTAWSGEFEGSITLTAIPQSVIPEPTSIALLLSGLAGLCLFCRKK